VSKKRPQNLRVVIAEPDVERRGRLREALREVTSIKNFDARSLREVTTILTDNRIDLAFISSAFEREPIKKFVASLEALPMNSKVPVVVTLQANAQAAPFVAEMYSQGVMGFLIEPFSVESIRGIFSLVTEEDQPQRDKKVADAVTTSFLLGDALKHFEKLVQLRYDGKTGGGYIIRDLRDDSAAMRETAASLSTDELADILLTQFSTAEPRPLKPNEEMAKVKKVKVVPHPGVELGMVMRDRRVSKDKFVATTKIPLAELEQILGCERDLSEDMAAQISRAVGRSKEYWFGLQQKFSAYRDSLIAEERARMPQLREPEKDT
jgi:plasmid maintenance system antidote protein VapI